MLVLINLARLLPLNALGLWCVVFVFCDHRSINNAALLFLTLPLLGLYALITGVAFRRDAGNLMNTGSRIEAVIDWVNVCIGGLIVAIALLAFVPSPFAPSHPAGPSPLG